MWLDTEGYPASAKHRGLEAGGVEVFDDGEGFADIGSGGSVYLIVGDDRSLLLVVACLHYEKVIWAKLTWFYLTLDGRSYANAFRLGSCDTGCRCRALPRRGRWTPS